MNGEIFNTDQGSQCTGSSFTGVLKDHEIRISMDGKGRAMDNIFVERLWRNLKYEEVFLKSKSKDMLSFLKYKIGSIHEDLIKSKKVDKKSLLITFLNPFSYSQARRRMDIFSKMDAFGIDGIVLVKLLNIFGISQCQRISFDMTSLAPVIFENASTYGKSIYLIGTKPEIIDSAFKNIKTLYPTLKIVGYRHGYFKDENERDKILHEIKILSPDILIAGMGTPLQEQFLLDLSEAGWEGIGYTCGGFLHQIASHKQYYPSWIDKLNLRWAYRAYDEPKLWYRYAVHYPKAVFEFFIDWINFKVFQKDTEY